MAFEMPSFIFGPGQDSATPESVKRKRAIAEALAKGNGTPTNIGAGIERISQALLSNKFSGDAATAEKAGTDAATQAYADLMSGGGLTRATRGVDDYASLLGNEWLNPGQQAVAQAMLGQTMERSDPAYQLDMDLKRAQLEAAQTPEPAKPPHTERIFDPETGMEKTVTWNPDTGGWEDLGGVKAPSGMSLTTNPDGTVSFSEGSGMGKPLTEGQSKDVVFLTRATGALETLNSVEGALLSLPETVGGQLPVVGNYLKSAEFQQAQQAGQEFLVALLRKDTGATVTPQENATYSAIYLPQPGDLPEVIAQKREARSRALQAMELGLPAQAIAKMEEAGVLGDVLAQPDAGATSGIQPIDTTSTGEPIYDATDYLKDLVTQ
jgi:hypothetical protein